MNRRTFTKYLLAAPMGLVALLTGCPTSSVSPEEEIDEELGQEEESFPAGRLVAVNGKWYVSYNGGTIWKPMKDWNGLENKIKRKSSSSELYKYI